MLLVVKKTVSIVSLAAALVVVTASGRALAADAAKPARLLVVTVTAGFRHASIGTAEAVLEEAAAEAVDAAEVSEEASDA